MESGDKASASSLKLVITGTGHCGTGFVADLFNKAGLKCGWESVFTHEYTPQDGLERECSAMALPYLERGFESVEVLHLVRHPANYIRSQMTRADKLFSWEQGKFLRKHCPVAEQWVRGNKPTVAWCARFWMDWNHRITLFASETYSIELIEQHLPELFAKVKTSQLRRHEHAAYQDEPLPRLESLPFYPRLKRQAENYGYSL